LIALRPARPGDAAAIAAIYAPYVMTGTVSFETEAPDAAAMGERMAASDGLYPWIVATNGEADGDNVLAYAYATKFRERPAYRYVVETSVYVVGPVQGQGVGKLLYRALIDTLRAQGFVQAVSVISLPNDYSINLHEATGFRRQGVLRELGFKQGRWIDVGFWQCELNDAAIPPAEPKKFSDVGLIQRA
jgi:L-amino acid N-acyltransferase YncA